MKPVVGRPDLDNRAGSNTTRFLGRGRAQRAPATLTGDSARLWTELQRNYAITDEAGILMLTLAAEAHERMRSAQAILAKEGLTVGAGNKLRAHPMVVVERDSRFAVAACLKQLGLDLEPVGKIGRPPGR
jgi:P27 family predicted phage terminase small subunit